MGDKKVTGRAGRIIPFILITILALIYLFPIILMFSTSVRTNDEVFNTSLGLWPQEWHFENYTNVFNVMPYWQYFGNTMFVTLMNVLGTVVCTPLIAYSLSKIQHFQRNCPFLVLNLHSFFVVNC